MAKSWATSRPPLTDASADFQTTTSFADSKVNMTAISKVAILGRRKFLVTGGALTAFGIIGGRVADAAPAERKRVLRVAHLTDTHVQPELRAADGLSACLRHVNDSKDRPDLILTGGDHIMDGFKQLRDRTAAQWQIWTGAVKNENSLPIRSCLGNHDIWGWNREKSGTTGQEPEYGKRWACDLLGLAKPYHSFDRAGWHFIALDSVQPSTHAGDFSAFIDEEQFDWLSTELANTPKTTPVLIWSHIPIVSAVVNHLAVRTSIHDTSSLEAGHIHADSVRLVALFAEHPNIKVCLSGHLHRIEHVEVKGIHYYCNGAVSGKWWKGANDGYPEGYAVADLYDAGHHELRYVTYGWKAEPPITSK